MKWDLGARGYLTKEKEKNPSINLQTVSNNNGLQETQIYSAVGKRLELNIQMQLLNVIIKSKVCNI